MQAIRVSTSGGPEVLVLDHLDDPAPGPGEVLVEVAAAGVNFIDTYQRSGTYPMALPTGLGLEGAGVIRAVGPEVDSRAVGDAVAWTDALGSYATHHVVRADRTVRVPGGVSLDQAAALMLQGLTAHYLSTSTHPLRRDEVALVYAPAGGVGRLLIQLAVKRGARVIAVTSSAEKGDIARRLGAAEVIDYTQEDIAAQARALTGGQGVDVVYDSVGKATFEASLDSLRPRGLMVLYGGASGQVPPIDLQVLNHKGSLYLTRPSLGHYIATTDELQWRAGALLDQVAAGSLEVHVHARYPLADAAQAHRDLESGQTAGKLLLDPGTDVLDEHGGAR